MSFGSPLPRELATARDEGFRWSRADEYVEAEWVGLGRLRASASGELISFEAAPSVPKDLLEKMREGIIAAFLRWLHGDPSLHASAVASERAALACIGESGAGKSTLARHLCTLEGVSLLADDIAGLELHGAAWSVVPSDAVLWLASGATPEKLAMRGTPRANAPGVLRWVASLTFHEALEGVMIRPLAGAAAAGVLVSSMVRFDAKPKVWKRELDLVAALMAQARVFEVARSHAIQPDVVASAIVREILRKER